MTVNMLEVGPGSMPLAMHMLGTEYNWLHFLDSSYTAIQPPQKPGSCNEFDTDNLDLPNVTFIQSRLQDTKLPSESFDEVFAANVISDPRLGDQKRTLLEHMGKAVRLGGTISFLDTYTPEVTPQPAALERFFKGAFMIIQCLELGNPDIQAMAIPTDAWNETAGVYSWAIRNCHQQQTIIHTGRFTQLLRVA